jgi:hypothetical protein
MFTLTYAVECEASTRAPNPAGRFAFFSEGAPAGVQESDRPGLNDSRWREE